MGPNLCAWFLNPHSWVLDPHSWVAGPHAWLVPTAPTEVQQDPRDAQFFTLKAPKGPNSIRKAEHRPETYTKAENSWQKSKMPSKEHKNLMSLLYHHVLKFLNAFMHLYIHIFICIPSIIFQCSQRCTHTRQRARDRDALVNLDNNHLTLT